MMGARSDRRTDRVDHHRKVFASLPERIDNAASFMPSEAKKPMRPHRIILTPTPGAVFLRTDAALVEMTPGEALRLCEQIRSCIHVALGAEDGRALHAMMSAGPA